MKKSNRSKSRNKIDMYKINSKNSKQKSKSILNFIKKKLSIKLPFKKKSIKKNENEGRSLPCFCKKNVKTRECLMIKKLITKINKIGSKKIIKKKSFFKWRKKIEIKFVKKLLNEDEICKCCLIEEELNKNEKNKKDLTEKNQKEEKKDKKQIYITEEKSNKKIQKNIEDLKNSLEIQKKDSEKDIIKKKSLETNSTSTDQILTQSIIIKKLLPTKKDFLTVPSSLIDNKKDENHIKLDIIRTFQDLKYFKKEKIKEKLNLAISMISTISKTGYVQGMNFWIGGIIYHTKNEEYFLKISKFIFINLNLERVYCFKTLSHYFEILESLLKLKLPKLYCLLNNNNCDLKLLLLDWFFCLGFNKVPLFYSDVLLNGLVTHGWFYFYRLIIVYLQYFNKFLKNKNMNTNNSLTDFNIQYYLKNFYKEKFLNWNKVLKKTKRIKLNPKIMDNLIWENSYKFKKIKSIF